MEGAGILVAEDNEINQQVVRELLEQAGCRVTCAANGRAAVAKISQTAFDAVLMDINMPDMDGFSATRAIRDDPANKRLPIIAMTAHAVVRVSGKMPGGRHG